VTEAPWAYAALAAAANVAGAAAVTARPRWSAAALQTILALSAGFMIAVALVELVPESIQRGGAAGGAVMLGGYLAVHLTQHTLAAHFHFGEETHAVSSSVSLSALAGLLLHTVVDGVAIASSYNVSPALGALVFVAIILHKLPEGVAISSMFLASGARRRSAIGAAAALGLATIVGVGLTAYVRPLAQWGLPLAAGVTLYVGASNLVPEIQTPRRWRNALAFFGGCALFVAARSIAF
jgi:zinc and cadmium transporter